MNRISWMLLLMGVLAALPAVGAPPLVVHEWGTITTRHAPSGTPQGELNRIEAGEVLPAFVHRYEPAETVEPPEARLSKQVYVPGRPDVTMRLETPVMYFYPPEGAVTGLTVDVGVWMRGGILNEFYPAGVAGVARDHDRIGSKIRAGILSGWDGAVLNDYVIGSLLWTGLVLRSEAALPETDSPVWLAPRAVQAVRVEAANGEAEQYLFYRGVAHLDALLRTELDAGALVLRAPATLHWLGAPSMQLASVWLADVRPGGDLAFRELGAITVSQTDRSNELARVELFTEDDYATNSLALRASMQTALTDAGLYDDEAEAMLETWKASYFQQPGLRLFYMVPRAWTDYFLPVSIRGPHKLTRAFVGRIDLLRE